MSWEGFSTALLEALQDEYRARSRYAKVLERFGPVWPFAAIAAAEQRHVDALLALFQRYGIPVPPDSWPARVTYPPTLAAACAAGVAGEIDNIALYDRLLRQVRQADIRQTFVHLQRASRESHLPAFRSCLAGLARASSSTSKGAGDYTFLLGFAVGATLTYLLSRCLSPAPVPVSG
jgi:hypothetical protein